MDRDPGVHGLLDGSCDVVCLPTHNGGVVHLNVMTCSVGMVIDGLKGPERFLEPFPKGPCRFPYVLLTTLQLVTYVTVDYSTLLCDFAPELGGHQEVFDGVASLEVDLDPHFPTDVFEVINKTGSTENKVISL